MHIVLERKVIRMNLEDQKKTGTNQINVSDSLEAPLLNIKVKRTSSTTIPSSNDLIVYVDTSPKSNPTSKGFPQGKN